MNCPRKSEFIVIWFTERSPRIWLYECSTSKIKKVIICAEPHIAEEYDQEFYLFDSLKSVNFSSEMLTAPCLRRVKQTPNISDPHHFFLVTLDTIGTIRLFDSAREFVPLAVLRTGDPHILRLSLSTTALLTISILDGDPGDDDDPTSGKVFLRFWKYVSVCPSVMSFRFNQPSLSEDLIFGTDENCVTGTSKAKCTSVGVFRGLPTNTLINNSCREFFSDYQPINPRRTPRRTIITKTFPKTNENDELWAPDNWPADNDFTPVLQFVSEAQTSPSVYLCDVIDSTYLAIWFSVPRSEVDEDWFLTVSNWKVFMGPTDLLTHKVTSNPLGK